jgi:hypothetical protein
LKKGVGSRRRRRRCADRRPPAKLRTIRTSPRWRGHWTSLGNATGALAQVDTHALLAKSITFSRPVVFDYVATRAELERGGARQGRPLADGTLAAFFDFVRPGQR